jgi:hypothetical protein
LRRELELEGQEVIRVWAALQVHEHIIMMRSTSMRWVVHVAGIAQIINECNILVKENEENGLLARLAHIMRDNIKMQLAKFSTRL